MSERSRRTPRATETLAAEPAAPPLPLLWIADLGVAEGVPHDKKGPREMYCSECMRCLKTASANPWETRKSHAKRHHPGHALVAAPSGPRPKAGELYPHDMGGCVVNMALPLEACAASVASVQSFEEAVRHLATGAASALEPPLSTVLGAQLELMPLRHALERSLTTAVSYDALAETLKSWDDDTKVRARRTRVAQHVAHTHNAHSPPLLPPPTQAWTFSSSRDDSALEQLKEQELKGHVPYVVMAGGELLFAATISLGEVRLEAPAAPPMARRRTTRYARDSRCVK